MNKMRGASGCAAEEPLPLLSLCDTPKLVFVEGTEDDMEWSEWLILDTPTSWAVCQIFARTVL